MKNLMIGLSLAALAAGGSFAMSAHAAADTAMAKRNTPMTRADAQARALLLFDRFDKNHDGKLDMADRAAAQAAMFDRIDTDHNGQISREEFTAAHSRGPGNKMAGDHNGGHRRGGGMGQGMGQGMGRGFSGGSMMARMADTNHDGAIARDEFVAAALQRFDKMDTNRDGTVSPEERRAARMMMRQQMRDRMSKTSDTPAQSGN